MRKISPKLKKEILADPYYSVCALSRRSGERNCQGRVTWEHAIIHAGKQLNEKWAIVPLCEFHHAVDSYQDGGDFKKERGVWIALNRANEDELRRVSKAIDYVRLRGVLNAKRGVYVPPKVAFGSGINY